MTERKIGIMGAMHEEIESIVHLIQDKVEVSIGNRIFHTGTINAIPVVVVFSRWGKVAAATTATSLVLGFGITDLFFIGVAGAIRQELKIGDIVIADQLIQHDIDARPLMPRHEVPLLGKTYFKSEPSLVSLAQKAISLLTEDVQFQSSGTPRIFTGTIASGDKFFSKESDKLELQKRLPELYCVEMEGAAVAQVCYEYAIPFLVIRTISDESDDQSHIDFPLFIRSVAQKYAAEIVRVIFEQLGHRI